MSASATASHGAIVGKTLASSTAVKATIAVAWYDAWAETRGLPKLAASTARQFCVRLHIQQLAHYAVHTYKKADGNHLSVGTAGDYVSAVMNAAARQFGDSAVVDDAGTTTKDFFAVLGGRGSTLAPQNNWYMQMLAGMRHAGTQREIEAGTPPASLATLWWPLPRRTSARIRRRARRRPCGGASWWSSFGAPLGVSPSACSCRTT